PTHRRRTLLLLMRLGRVLADIVLPVLPEPQAVDQPRADQHSNQQRRDPRGDDAEGWVLHEFEKPRCVGSAEVLVEQVDHRWICSAISPPSCCTTRSSRIPRLPLTSTRSPDCSLPRSQSTSWPAPRNARRWTPAPRRRGGLPLSAGRKRPRARPSSRPVLQPL